MTQNNLYSTSSSAIEENGAMRTIARGYVPISM